MTRVYAGAVALLATSGFAQAADSLVEEAAKAEGYSEPFLQQAETWVLAGFIIFVAAVARPLWRAMTGSLDKRAEAIKAELDEAQRLREEAQHTLAEYQRKQRDALAEAEAIIAEAREEAKRMQKATEERTSASLERREQQALDMIAAAEARAVADVRALAADVAIDATRRVLEDVVEGQKGDELINEAIAEVPAKLN
ncbi:MAG: F0F1 ATP synthase subunit B [Alphaproteobacteria bacterium]|nr:F0F1 ATP synthase subunit B [Alphaproteobacteria bacterium]